MADRTVIAITTPPGQLHDLHSLLAPGFSQALLSQFLIDFHFVVLNLLQHGKFLADLEFLQCTDLFLLGPPFLAKQPLFRQHQIVAVKQTLQPIANHSTGLHQALTV